MNSDRAVQFQAFAALKGYSDMVIERERFTEPKRELSDDDAQALSDKLVQLQALYLEKKAPSVKITYYHIERYETIEGAVSAFDEIFFTLRIGKTVIPFSDILDISDEVFPQEQLA